MKEEILIKKIKFEQSEDALIILFEIYRPMTESMKRRFYIRCFDQDDLEQESLICCFEAVMTFDRDKGKFGSYYKRKLNNKFISLLRKHQSLRRRGNELALSFEDVSSDCIEKAVDTFYTTIDENEYEQFWAHLSEVEQHAFKVCLGIMHINEVLEETVFTIEQVKRAESRVMKKFSEWLINK